MTTFAPGSLVQARGREWVVLPDSADDLLVLRPIGGSDDEVTGILSSIEDVVPATFAWPDPRHPGDFRSASLLRQALRLGFRSSAGPFRSFGSIAVEPRPYQLVPLLMALRQETTRLLIADSIGIGKSVEALLIARELLETGAANRLAVLCPPHLAVQWQREMAEKFHIEAELVLPSTAPRLERASAVGQTLFELHPYVIVSTDYIKAERRRAEFLRTCPELVIIDEAHTCVVDAGTRSTRHQRHELVAGLAADPSRHLVLVTATPHSGIEGAFRSLLSLLDPDFADLPDDLSGAGNEALRRRLAEHLLQRRRADITAYLAEDTPFPEREDAEATYILHPEYRKLFERALAYARETVRDTTGGHHRQRVRWWSALALLRSLASSPAAASATLRARAETAATATAEEADELGRRNILDAGEDDGTEGIDVVSGADPTTSEESAGEQPAPDSDAAQTRRRLLEMARLAESLEGEKDAKLTNALAMVDGLVADGYHPIVFCRFIPTADYVADALRRHFAARPDDEVEVMSVTGTLAPAERETRVLALAESLRRVLVATDCLSEGINLQDHFDAVVHYDLAWSPTRHEQREGRVDRFGQPAQRVRVISYYGTDNQIDGIVLDVLLRKHRLIRKRLGVAVPVPAAGGDVMEAIFEGLLLRERHGADTSQLMLFDDISGPKAEQLQLQWDDAAEAERRSQTMFAQQAIKVDEVAKELAAARDAVGSSADVETFIRAAVAAHGGVVADASGGAVTVALDDAPAAVRDAVRDQTRFRARFQLPLRSDKEVYLSRTHPFVEGLASFVLTSALDDLDQGGAARCGAIRTDAVSRRTTLLLVRNRFDVVTTRSGGERVLLAEDAGVIAFAGPPDDPEWLGPEAVARLLDAVPSANVAAEQATGFIARVVANAATLSKQLAIEAGRRADELLASHRRVRSQSGVRGVRYRVSAHLPPDVLGVYVLLPAGGSS